MNDTGRPDCFSIHPSEHPSFGPDSINSKLHAGTMPADFPLFNPFSATGSPATDAPPGSIQYLVDYNQRIGNPVSPELKSKLANNARLIIAGQQPGLLLGPLYTVWKLLSAIAIANDAQRHADTVFVPAFWIASEDHDILEVNRVAIGRSTYVADPEFDLVRGQLRPVGMVTLESHREPLLTFLKQSLGQKPSVEWLTDRVAQCDFSNYATFFTSFAIALFKESFDFLFIDALDARKLTSPFLAEAVEHFDAVENAFQSGSDRVRQAAFSPPLNECGIFEITEGDVPARRKCRIENERFKCSEGNVSLSEAANYIRQYPERFSAGAALRPILQDAAFPVTATLCGPTEMLYLWQIDPIYRTLNITRSSLYPRISATLLPASAGREIRMLPDPSRLFSPTLLSVIGRESNRDQIETDDLEHVRNLSRDLIDSLKNLSGVDPLMAGKAVGSIEHHVTKIADNLLAKRRDAVAGGLKRLKKVQDLALPGGKAQERVVNVCEVIAQYGPDCLSRIMEVFSPADTAHQLVIMNI